MCKNRLAISCLALLVGFVSNLTAQEANKISCAGKVINAESEPIAGAKVMLYEMGIDPAIFKVELKQSDEMITKADGAFRFTVEASQSTTRAMALIVAERKGLALGWANWELKEDIEVEIKLDQAKILAGMVVDEVDNPVVGAEVRVLVLLMGEAPRPRYLIGVEPVDLLLTMTNEQGKFSFNNIPGDATAEFLVKKPGRATISTFDPSGGTTLHYAPGQTDIKLVMPVEARIEGIVVEKARGKPVGGIRLIVMQGQNRPLFGQELVTSKEDGTFVINALSPGKHIVRFVPKQEKIADWVAQPVEVTLEGGETRTGVKVELSTGGVVEVTVTELDDNTPVEKANVSVTHIATNEGFDRVTDKEGIARIRLAPGEYKLTRVYKSDYQYERQDKTFAVEDGKTSNVSVQLRGYPKITGTVRDEKGKPVAGAKIKVCPLGRGETTSDEEGRFEVRREAPQWAQDVVPYVVARHFERNLAAAVEIGEDTKKVEVKLIDGVVFFGKVVDIEGKPIEGAKVYLTFWSSGYGSSMPRKEITTDAHGYFEVKTVPPWHQYSVNASADGYGQDYARVHADDAENNRLEVGSITLALANLSISGVVVDVDDKPVANARVFCSGRGQSDRSIQTDAEGKFTIDKVCAGRVRLSVNTTGTTRLYGSIETEGGATNVRVVVSERSSTTRYVPKQAPSLVGRPLPELKGLKIYISPANVSDKMILVCFWDINQRPSRYCIRQLAKQAEQLKQKGVTIVAVQASKVDESALNEWAKKQNIPFPVGTVEDDVEKTKFIWGVHSLPWLILTDRKHIISSSGFAVAELSKKIETIIQKQD